MGESDAASIFLSIFFIWISVLGIVALASGLLAVIVYVIGTALFLLFIFFYDYKRKVERTRLQKALDEEQWRLKNAFEEEQRKKGLVKFVDRFGNGKWGNPSEVKKWAEEDDAARIKESLEYRVAQLIKEFKPARKLRDEYVYENSLYSWLKSQFPEIKVQMQKGSSRPDIVIENIAIEIKGPTHRADQLDSVLGKLLRYPQHFEKVIVVLFDVTVSESYYNDWLIGLKNKFPEVEVIRKEITEDNWG